MARTGPESVIEQHLRLSVEDAGGQCLKLISTKAGVPDRVVVLNGWVVFVELKRPELRGRKIPALQEAWHTLLRRAAFSHGIVKVVATKSAADELVAELVAERGPLADPDWAEQASGRALRRV